MADCEWQLRQIHQQNKEKSDKIMQERELALERAEELQNELEERKQEVEGLKVYQAEVKSLRGVVAEQELAIKSLMQQIDNIRGELQQANTNLEEQMKAVKKIKNQCDKWVKIYPQIHIEIFWIIWQKQIIITARSVIRNGK